MPPDGRLEISNEYQPTDHDLLVRLDERVGQLISWTKTHDQKHNAQRRGILGAMGAGVLAIFSAVLGWLFRP